MRTSAPPALTIGSIASTMPSSSTGPLPGLAEVRDLRVLVHVAADAVADEGADDREPVALDALLDGVGDVAEVVAGHGLGDALEERVTGGRQQRLASVGASRSAR